LFLTLEHTAREFIPLKQLQVFKMIFMYKNILKRFITFMLLASGFESLNSQTVLDENLENDSLFRYATTLKELDSLLGNISQKKIIPDTSFYKSYTNIEELSLDKLIKLAINNNPELKNISYKSESERLKAEESGWLMDPMFEIEGDDIESNFKSLRMLNFYASQSFPFPGKLRLTKESNLYSSRMLNEEYKFTGGDIIYRIKLNYYDLYLNSQKIKINKDNQLIVKSLTTAAEIKYSISKGMQQEIFKSQIELSRLRNELYILLQQEKIILSNLSELTKNNLDTNSKITFTGFDINYLTQEWVFDFDEGSITNLTNYAFDNRTDLKALRLKMLMNNTEIEKSKLDYLPDFNLRLGYKIFPHEDHNAFSIMFGVNVPFAPWSSGKYDLRIQKEKINLKSTYEEFDTKRNEIQKEIKNTIEIIKSARETMVFYEDVMIPQSENTFKSTLYSYENDMTSFLDMLDSYKIYQDAKLMFHESQNMLLNALNELEKITGLSIKNN